MIPSVADACIYTRHRGSNISLVMFIYVDDKLLLTNDDSILRRAKVDMRRRFDMREMGPVKRFLGKRIIEKPESNNMSQTAYVIKRLGRFKMLDAKEQPIPLVPGEHMNRLEFPLGGEGDEKGYFSYRELFGCLLNLSVCTRHDIAFDISSLARFVSKPRLVHWNSLKKLFSYGKGTKDYGIWYGRVSK